MFILAIIISVVVIIAISSFFAHLFVSADENAVSSSVQEAENDSVVEISLEDMDKHFDRSPGRFCEHCGIHGSHHTDRHNDFANSILNRVS